MAITKLKENPTYGMTQAAYSLAGTLPRRKKPVNVGKYKNVAEATGKPTQPTATTPKSFSNLGRVSVPYGGSTKYEKFHPGVDIAAKEGTPVPAFSGGTVSQVISGQGWTPGSPSFGNYVIVTDAEGNKHRYSHLYQSYVKVGQQVTPGSAIGAMGKTGSTYSPSGGDPSHLDYRIRDAYGKYVNPMIYLSQLQR